MFSALIVTSSVRCCFDKNAASIGICTDIVGDIKTNNSLQGNLVVSVSSVSGSFVKLRVYATMRGTEDSILSSMRLKVFFVRG
jgi:hypothetical protein